METLIKDLEDYIKIASVIGEEEEGSPYGAEISKALDYMLKKGADYGFQVKNLDNQVGLIEYGQGEEALGILVHCDVVPAGNGWTYNPFELTSVEGKLYGRGVVDNKGPALACLHAMKALKDSAVTTKRKVQMIIGTDEETLWRGIERFVKHEKMPRLGFTPDGNFPLIHAEKGILDIDLTYPSRHIAFKNNIILKSIKAGMSRNSVSDRCEIEFITDKIGSAIIEKAMAGYFAQLPLTSEFHSEVNTCKLIIGGKSAHAMTPEKGQNAITHAMALLSTLSEEPKGIIKHFDKLVGIDLYGEGIGCKMSDDISGPLTLNVGQCRYDGTELKFHLNVRYPVSLSPEAVCEQFKEAFEQSLFTYEQVDHLKPLYVPKDNPIVTSLMGVYQRHTGDIASKPMVIGGGTYARVLENTVAFGPVFPGQVELAHEADEYINESDLYKLVDMYKEAIEKLANLDL